MRNTLVDFAAEIQRAQIERDLRRLRIGRLMEGMKFCPACFPELFDAGLEYTPNPVFCRAHASHVLAQVFAEVRRDAAGVSRLVAHDAEAMKCA